MNEKPLCFIGYHRGFFFSIKFGIDRNYQNSTRKV